MIDDKKKALDKAKKAKSKGGNTISEKIASEKERKAAIDKAQAELDFWKGVAEELAKWNATTEAPQADTAEETATAEEAATDVAPTETTPTDEGTGVTTTTTTTTTTPAADAVTATDTATYEATTTTDEADKATTDEADRTEKVKPTTLDGIPSEWKDSRLQSATAVKVDSPLDIPDDVFTEYTHSVILPRPEKGIETALGGNNKLILIKRSVFAKNNITHGNTTKNGLSPQDSRTILNEALYYGTHTGKTQPSKKPNYWVVIRNIDKSRVVVLEVSNSKEYLEVIGWEYRDEKGIRNLYNQADKNGGWIVEIEKEDRSEDGLTLIQDKKESSAADLSALTPSSSDKDTTPKGEKQETDKETARRKPKGFNKPEK
ncbi:MAG: hypothetical protein ACI4A8_02580, partial [Muribaculaceae bacterium]